MTVEIDDIDRALIDQLVADGRASYTALARQVEMSQAAVKTRVKRLIDNGVIHILGRIDPRVLGYGEFAYCLVDVAGRVDPVAKRLAELDEAAFVLIFAGGGGLFIELRARDAEHLNAAIETLRADPQVRGVEVASLIAYIKQDWSQVAGGAHQHGRAVTAPSRGVDNTDIKILQHLARDGRATYTDLALTAAMSPAGAREQVLGLIGSGVVTVQTIVSPGVRGLRGYAGLLIQTSGPVRAAAQAIAQRPDVALVATVLGRFDLIVEVGSRNETHLAHLLDEIRATDNVYRLDAFIYLVEVKESMTAGLV